MERITKKEAMDLLGVSERQLQRITSKNRLSVEYVKQKQGARKAMYNLAELHQLKREQENSEVRGQVVTAPEPDRTPEATQMAVANPLAVPPQGLQVMAWLNNLGGQADGNGRSIQVEEVKMDQLIIRPDGSTRIKNLSVTRHSATA